MNTISAEKIEVLLSQLMKGLYPHPSKKPVLHNITFAQMRIMWILGDKGKLSMSQIAEMTDVSRATISSVVDRLVKSKFVSRIRDEKDRRVVRLRLIGKGKKFIQTHKRLRRKRMAQLLENLSACEQERLVLCFEELNSLISKSHSRNKDSLKNGNKA
jgi:DNA-binding MarR family transcriptional regulator